MTKINKRGKGLKEVNMMIKKFSKTLNEIMSWKTNACVSYFESEGMFLMKPYEIDSYFNFFTNKVDNLRQSL